MSRFNLIDEKWIPVRSPDGTRDEIGIRETLLRSDEILSIEDPSPLVVASLHRFLLAVLYRALEGPTDIDQAKQMFNDGFSESRITNYLDRWRDRFWLFDGNNPFGQNPNVPADRVEPWTKLTAEYNATSNKVLFDHTNTNNPGTRKPNECARWLVSTMTFSISGGRGYYPSPSPNAMMCIPLGQNLKETLSFNLVPYQNREVMQVDSALWERSPKTIPLDNPKRVMAGYADLYTWQSRLINLEETSNDEVKRVRFMAGQGFENPAKNPDPMHPYKIDKKYGTLPVQFREDRGTWRDLDSLLPDDGGLAPLTIQNALRLGGSTASAVPISVLVLGLRYTPPNANVDFWRMERFILPVALKANHNFRTDVQQLLTFAEEAQKKLWMACNGFAKDILSRGERQPHPKDLKDFVNKMPVSPMYWSILEYRFHEILRDYTLRNDPDDILCQWLKFVREALRTSWGEYSKTVLLGNSWAIRAIIKAERPVMEKLKELNVMISKLEPQGEQT